MSQLHEISGCGNAARKADVLFIHGLGGDAFSTWRHGKDASTSWPHWLGKEFPDVGVWSLGYAASPTRLAKLLRLIGRGSRDSGHSMALPDRALQVLDLMTQKGLGQRPLLFVCHSLGGLVAKQILRKASDATDERKQRVARQTRAVLFLATPHAGAALASLVDAFRTVFGATVNIEDLRAHDAHLRDLFDWYRNHAPQLRIETATYFELRSVKGTLPIVNPTSGHPGVGADPVGLDEDHLSIVKPRQPDAQVCNAARDLLRNCVLLAPPPGPATTASAPPAPRSAMPPPPTQLAQVGGNSNLTVQAAGDGISINVAPPPQVVVNLPPGLVASGQPPRIPRELPPAAYKFFGRETELRQLTERLRDGLNTAVVGPAGLGKTALAAHALAEVVGAGAANLAASPFPDGIVFLDLYTHHGQAEPAWNTLANHLRGVDFLERRPARERAAEACRARRPLLIIEGGEEADGSPGRATIPELFSVLSPENRWLLLTRLSTQAAVAETVKINEALHPQEAAALLDWLTRNRPPAREVRQTVLDLLEGHPLALNWAGNLLASDEEDPASLADDWQSAGLPKLSDPTQAQHTLQWLFQRSVRGLDDTARQTLAAAGLLARAPFPLEAIAAALGVEPGALTGSTGGSPVRPGKNQGKPALPEARSALTTLVRHGLLRRAENDHWQFTHVLGYRFARDEDASDPALRQRLGRWLHAHLRAVMKASAGGETALPMSAVAADVSPLHLDSGKSQSRLTSAATVQGFDARTPTGANLSLARPLEHAAALLRADHDQPLWQPLANYLLYDGYGRLVDLGRLELVKLALRAVAGWMERFPPAKAAEPAWQRERSAMLNRQGNVLIAQGDLAGALQAYREMLTVSQRLASADPSNAGWQRDLSVSQNKVGDVLSDQGDLAGALQAFRESLTVIQRLASADPSNAGWQRDLAISHERLGDVALKSGEADSARQEFEMALTLFEALVRQDPTNAALARCPVYEHHRLAELRSAHGERDKALAHAESSLSISERLAVLDPSNVTWQEDVQISRWLVAEVRAKR